MQRSEERDTLERLARIWEKLADVREHYPELEVGPQMGSPKGHSQIAQQQF